MLKNFFFVSIHLIFLLTLYQFLFNVVGTDLIDTFNVDLNVLSNCYVNVNKDTKSIINLINSRKKIGQLSIYDSILTLTALHAFKG